MEIVMIRCSEHDSNCSAPSDEVKDFYQSKYSFDQCHQKSGLEISCLQARYTYTVYICTRSRQTSAPLGTDLLGGSLAMTETYSVSSFDMPQRPSGAASTARENKKERHVICIRLRYYASVESLIVKVYVTSAATFPWLYWFVTPHHIPTKAFERNSFGENFNLQSKIQTQLSAVKVPRFASTFELQIRQWTHWKCEFSIAWIFQLLWIWNYKSKMHFVKGDVHCRPVNRCWANVVIKFLAMPYCMKERSVLIKCQNQIILKWTSKSILVKVLIICSI